MDIEFEPVSAKILHLTVNMAAAHEHVGEIEIDISLVKERGKATPNTLPFRAVIKKVIIKLVYFTELWPNDFPSNTVIS